MYVCLRTQGREFNIRVGIVELTYEQWQAEWVDVAKAFQDGRMTQETRDRCLEESEAFNQPLSLVAAIRAKGFELPVTMARRN